MKKYAEGVRRREDVRIQIREALAERLNDDRRRGRVCATLMSTHSLRGELDEALVTGTRALEIAGRLGDLRLRIRTTTNFLQAHYFREGLGMRRKSSSSSSPQPSASSLRRSAAGEKNRSVTGRRT